MSAPRDSVEFGAAAYVWAAYYSAILVEHQEGAISNNLPAARQVFTHQQNPFHFLRRGAAGRKANLAQALAEDCKLWQKRWKRAIFREWNRLLAIFAKTSNP
jgi:hypothetical protein